MLLAGCLAIRTVLSRVGQQVSLGTGMTRDVRSQISPASQSRSSQLCAETNQFCVAEVQATVIKTRYIQTVRICIARARFN